MANRRRKRREFEYVPIIVLVNINLGEMVAEFFTTTEEAVDHVSRVGDSLEEYEFIEYTAQRRAKAVVTTEYEPL